MADDADRADRDIQNEVASGIARARKNMLVQSLVPVQKCYWCTSPVTGAHVFCPDDSCAEDYAYEQRRKKEQGL